MRSVEGLVGAVSLWMARAGGVFLLLAAIIISVEILARKFLLFPFNVGTELSTYALAVGASWSFSYALLHRAHVRIDVARSVLQPWGRAVLDVLALFSLAAVALVLCWYVSDTVVTSWRLGARENTPLATPLVIPQGLWLVGLAWFAAVASLQAVQAVQALLRRDLPRIGDIAGPGGSEEELEDSLRDAETRLGTAG